MATPPKALEKIKELYQKGLSQRQIANELNALRKTDREGYGHTKWEQTTVSLHSRRAGLTPANAAKGRTTKKTRRKYKRRPLKTATPSFIDVPMQAVAASDKIAVIICTHEQIKNILEGLK